MKRIVVIIVLIMMTMLVNAQRTAVKVSALPEPLPKFLNTHYPGYTTEKATKVIDKNNQVTYETVITKGTARETLIFDRNGTFLKKKTEIKTSSEKSRLNPAKQDLNKTTKVQTKQSSLDTKSIRLGEQKEEERPVQKRDTVRK
jgi:hypothetical protein